MDDLYPEQRGLVKNGLEKLVKGPLATLGIGANLGTFCPYFTQIFTGNGATMGCGVVYDHFGHDMIFVLRSSRLLTLDFKKTTGSSPAAGDLLYAAPCDLRGGEVKSETWNLSGLRIGHRGNMAFRVAVTPTIPVGWNCNAAGVG
jgi:hypothetical protein